MAVQYSYEKDRKTKTAFKYASFPTLDAMNTFDKFAIDTNDAREYCIENGVLTDDDFDGDMLADAGRAKLPDLLHITSIYARNISEHHARSDVA